MGLINTIKNKLSLRTTPSLASWFLGDSDCTDLKARGYVRLSDCPEVRMGIERIADLVSMMTIHLMQNDTSGDVRIQNALSRKIDINPNKYMTRQLWVHWIVKTVLLDGNSIIYPEFKEGLINDLIPIPSEKVRFESHGNDYKIIIGKKTYNYDEVLHFRINPKEQTPWMGQSYKVVLKDVVDNLKQASYTTNEFMSNRVIPNLIVKVDAMTDELANQEGRARVYDKYLTASKAGEPWIIPSGLMDVQQVKPLTLNDIAIKDTIQLSKETVAGILGVPAFLLGSGNYNEKQYNHFIQTRIAVIAKAIEQELTKKLLYAPDLYFKFSIQSLYSYGFNERANVYSRLYSMGLYTGNEVRDKLGDSPIEGLDELTILENYIPVDKIGDQKKLGGEVDEQEEN